jgi:hypothetical protein
VFRGPLWRALLAHLGHRMGQYQILREKNEAGRHLVLQ